LERYRLPGDLLPFERVTVDELRPYLAAAGGAPYEAHLHGFNQIIWFRAGAGLHLADFVEYEYGPRTLVYVPHGAVHAFRGDNASDGVILHFDDAMAMGSSDGQSLPSILRTLAFSSRPTRALSASQASSLESRLESLSSEVSSRETFGKATAIEAALRLVLVRVCRQFQEAAEPGSKDYTRYLEFLELVESRFREGMPVEAYAKRLGVSSKTLSRSVRDAASCSPSHVVAERVALEMKRPLVHTDLSVKEVAARVGMADASYSTRFFRKRCGVTPSAFRKSWT
jgi:AraC-like DNA-binding protein